MNTMESDSRATALGLRRRDPDLLDRLITQHQHRLLRYLVHLSGDHDLAKDLFQETWVRVMERGHQYDGRGEFRTWLFTVARNITLDHFRRKRPVSLDGLLEDEHHAGLEPVDPGPSVLESMARHDQVERVNAALLKIPGEYRETVVLRFQEGLSLEEISTVTKMPLGTVKSRLYRGLNLLMNQLKGIGS